MVLKLHATPVSAVTSIPNIFFDTYMPRANGDFLRVYLYLYRWQNSSDAKLSVTAMADTLGLTEGDITRALKYWQSEGLIALITDTAGNCIEEIIMRDINTAARTQTAKASHQAAAAEARDFTKPAYTMNEILNFSTQNDGDKLFFVIQQYLGRPLSQTDTNTIVFFHEKLGFSIDLIEYLFEYCVSNNHRSIHYIERVAISWAEKGIKTVSEAKNESSTYNKTYYAVLKAFGITGRAPTEGEITFIKRWHEDYCFPMPLILEACSRTMLATHNPSFEYTDKILKNWKNKKVTNIDDVKALDAAYEASKRNTSKYSDAKKTDTSKENGQKDGVRRYGSRFGNFDQRVYNYNELEQRLAKKLQKH